MTMKLMTVAVGKGIIRWATGAVILSMGITPLAQANMCYGPTQSFSQGMNNSAVNASIDQAMNYIDTYLSDPLQGVILDKALTVLNSMPDLQGAVFNPKKGEMVFIGANGTVPIDERIEIDDLIAVVRAIYVKHESPGVTFYTKDMNKAFATGQWDVSYFAGTQNTQPAR
ncbi:MAG: hypothetical protein AABY83_11790 [Pseudomonadota bacterium]